MVDTLFTALALIATGQAKMPPAPTDLAPPPAIRRPADPARRRDTDRS